jgi:hypothetical protein
MNIEKIKYKVLELHGITHEGRSEVIKCNSREELNAVTAKNFDRYKALKQIVKRYIC